MVVSTKMPSYLADSVLGKDYQRIIDEHKHPIYWINDSPFADTEGVISLSWMFLYPHRIEFSNFVKQIKYVKSGETK